MISETQQGYTTGYGSPENILKQLYEEYNKKINLGASICILFGLIILNDLLDIGTITWSTFFYSMSINAAGFAIIYFILRYITRKETIATFKPENYPSIIQQLKKYFYPFSKVRLLLLAYIILNLAIFLPLNAKVQQATGDSGFSMQGFLMHIVYCVLAFLFLCIQSARKIKQFNKIEKELGL